MEHAPTEASLRAVFADWTDALNGGRLDSFYEYFHEKSNILDEDFPWTMTKAEFVDHLDFLVSGGGDKGLWEFFKWLPREVQFLAVGSTGHVAGFATFRGKVRDTGFRQRFMGFTLTWAFADGRWQMLCWHQSVLAGRIAGASPA
jgi:hypothetical protein